MKATVSPFRSALCGALCLVAAHTAAHAHTAAGMALLSFVAAVLFVHVLALEGRAMGNDDSGRRK